MPSALETLVKILKLEQDTGYQDKAVIGGLKSFGAHWASDAHAQAKKPEHHALVDELAVILEKYGIDDNPSERHETIKYMLGRITGRIPPPAGVALRAIEAPMPPAEPPAPIRPPRKDEPRPARRQEKQQEPEPPAPVEAVAEEPKPEPPAPGSDPFNEDEPLTIVEAPPAVETARQAKSARMPHRKSTDPDRNREMIRAIKASVSTITGIGPKIAEKLEQLDIYTIEDLLYFFPRRYDDYTRMVPLSRVEPGQTLTVIGTVRSTNLVKGKRGIEVLNVLIDDGSGLLTASFFGQPYLRGKMERGLQVVFSGKTDLFRGQMYMSNPEWELLEREALHTRSIVPVYPLTKGLSAHNLRKFTRTAVEQYASQIPDYMPESVLERMDLPDLGWAIQQMHFPASMEALGQARRRLSFDELILLQLGVLRQRREWQSVSTEHIMVTDEWLAQVKASLPYELTGAQSRAIDAIRADLGMTVPMNRLLQGDVGAGKTVVAAVSMAMAVSNGFQAAIIAPTSILAEQHLRGISRLLENLPDGDQINVRLLTGATSTQERSDTLWGLGEGSVHVIIGTHALLEDEVHFHRLGLVVIDEQHRFGVEQRGKLRSKGQNPHALIMTATPIPRTLALTRYADLDLTVLDEMPPGRTPVETRVLEPKHRERIYSFIDSQIEKGRQAFIVYPLVEESEEDTADQPRSAVEAFEKLQKEVFYNRTLGLLHGRMTPSEKDEVMAAFSRGEIHLLVSTSVVEVGIDVPNATVMMIEGANRFGLAQLHQFRGRVGRGQHSSHCILISDDGEKENARLKAMEETTDGFKLAQIDFELRGAGELLGTRQSGGKAGLGEAMDPKLVAEAQTEARTIYEEDPELTQPEHAALRELLHERYGYDTSSADVS